MKIVLLIGAMLLSFSFKANAYVWISAVPTEVHIVGEGLVLLGDFDITGISCAKAKAIFLPKEDPQYQAKISLALTAKATNKKIQVLINDPLETSCFQVTALGFVPIAYYYYWQLKD